MPRSLKLAPAALLVSPAHFWRARRTAEALARGERLTAATPAPAEVGDDWVAVSWIHQGHLQRRDFELAMAELRGDGALALPDDTPAR